MLHVMVHYSKVYVNICCETWRRSTNTVTWYQHPMIACMTPLCACTKRWGRIYIRQYPHSLCGLRGDGEYNRTCLYATALIYVCATRPTSTVAVVLDSPLDIHNTELILYYDEVGGGKYI